MEDGAKEKGPLKLDWDKLMPDDDPPPPPESREFAGHSDTWIENQIKNYTKLEENLTTLKDKGEKLRARIKALQAEQERRRLCPANVDEPKKLMQSKRRNLSSDSDDFMETPPSQSQASQSEFGVILNRKLDESLKEINAVNAFEKELADVRNEGNRNSIFKKNMSIKGKQNGMISLKQSPFRCPTKISADSNKRNISDHNQNRNCSTHLSQKQKDSPSSPFMRTRLSRSLSSKDSGAKTVSSSTSSKRPFVLVDEEEPEPEPEPVEITEQVEEDDEFSDDGMKDYTIYYPSRDDPESVEICYKDMQCLAPKAYLSSTIMNFYIRHLQQPTLETERGRNDYHFFNTYFYNKLTEAVSKADKESSFIKLRRWWKGVDIFQKAYILLPIHESLHWSLVIICIPDKKEDSGPIILHLDSLGLHSSGLIFENVKSFLTEEWKHLNQEEAFFELPFSNRIWKNLCRRIDDKRIPVPQQRNEYDCGLFVLYFMERFLFEAPQRLKRKDLAMFGKKWFKPEEASDLRPKIKKLLKEEFRKATQDNCVPEVAAEEQMIDQPIDVSEFIMIKSKSNQFF